ncbi:unnamed protein product [Brachionus calyciflorus]|uniref:Integrase catalytic domain-containing protein n=1 Tax=Brachionus calyciflorus TaxID=104777 RepID=A0A814EGB0_9BILA|nr:unnamed protein product [Brachionus calyciflorus]
MLRPVIKFIVDQVDKEEEPKSRDAYNNVLLKELIITKKVRTGISKKFANKSQNIANSYESDGKKIFIVKNNIQFIYQDIDERKEIINKPLAFGHFQSESTFNRIKDDYYWHVMVDDIKQSIKECTTCQKNNKTITKYHHAQVSQLSNLVKRVANDLILGLDEREEGYIGILVIIEFLSNFPYAKKIKRKSAKEKADILIEYISLFGPFSELLSDQGKEFLNNIMSELKNRLGFVHIVTSAYNPRTNG